MGVNTTDYCAVSNLLHLDGQRHYLRLILGIRRGVWRYERFACSTKALINALNEFKSLRVDFISYQENIDPTTPQGEMVFSIMASFAQWECALIGEHTKASMQRAGTGGSTWHILPSPHPWERD